MRGQQIRLAETRQANVTESDRREQTYSAELVVRPVSVCLNQRTIKVSVSVRY